MIENPKVSFNAVNNDLFFISLLPVMTNSSDFHVAEVPLVNKQPNPQILVVTLHAKISASMLIFEVKQ